MVLNRDSVEAVGALRLPLGGVNGYVGVRSRQGYNKDKFQGTTPNARVYRAGHPAQLRSRSCTCTLG